MSQNAIVFIDSSIQVSRTIREAAMKARIAAWLSRYRLKVTGTVAIQEFKNRVLRDLAYLLTKLNQTDSYQRSLEYVTNVLPKQHQRKQRICLTVLHNILPGRSDQELTERARLYIRTLLVHGENELRRQMDSVVPGIDCYWAKVPVREKKRYVTYDLGERQCSKTKNLCQVGSALQSKRAVCENLLRFLQSLPPERMTSELQSAHDLLNRIVNGTALQNIHQEEPCLKAGDLLLALESEGVPDFYTMNYRESQAYCDFLQQSLTIRPNNPSNNEHTHLQSSKPWPNP